MKGKLLKYRLKDLSSYYKKLDKCIFNIKILIYRPFRTKKVSSNKKDINYIYLSPADNDPIGGIKVIYKHSELLSSMGYSSYVYHPQRPNFSCNWFDHKAKIKKDKYFDKKVDFVIVPEIWVDVFCPKLIDLEIKFAIFVQNPYILFENHSTIRENILDIAFKKCELIVSISEDASRILNKIYPEFNHKILRVYPHVPKVFIEGKLNKENIISYMPRKMPKQTSLLLFLLRKQLPKNWSLVSINNMTENDVVKNFQKSSIFLSFCNQEGFGLPPLEAALCGSMVVGYTGEGAKEYFKYPLFRPISSGNLSSFCSEVIKLVDEISSKKFPDSQSKIQFKNLKDEYSLIEEKKRLNLMSKKIKESFVNLSIAHSK